MRQPIKLLLNSFIFVATALVASPPSPEQFFGRNIGEDGFLASWPDVVAYFTLLDAQADRVRMEVAGQSTLGNDIPLIVLTTESNLRDLETHRQTAKLLANPDHIDEKTAEDLIKTGKVIVLVTCTIHSSEVGATQMAMEFAHDLATTQDPEVLGWMNDVIILLMPSINPDGQLMVVDWYHRYLGTEYEGGRMPWLYHHYVGHDNNRDFFMLTQKESQVVNDVVSSRWFPQVFLDEHQMGSTGPRMFVPPQTDPLAPEVHPLVFRQADLLGTTMAMRLEEAGKTGVGSNMIFDSYWPGGTRNTAWWKNVTGLLTEVASVHRATPVFIDPGELRGGSKGFPEYKRQANFPSPWPGGWWRLRDIVDYELIATRSVLETASRFRQGFLRNFYVMSHSAVEAGHGAPPYAFIIPPDQHDPVAAGRLVDLLIRHGVRVTIAEKAFSVGHLAFPAQTYVVTAAQPYRSFLLTMLRPQRYPEIRTHAGGPIIPPYDATSWSLPISMGVTVVEADRVVEAALTPIDSAQWETISIPETSTGFLIPHRADTAFTAINRMLAAGKEMYFLGTTPLSGNVGDVYLPATDMTTADLRQYTDDLHLPVQSLVTLPTGSAFRVNPVRVGLFKPWRASMDEGWTRFVLESYEFNLTSIHNKDVEKGTFVKNVDVLLFPDVEPSIIEKGELDKEKNRRRRLGPLPPEFVGGIGEKGGKHLKKWVSQGGTLIAMNRSTAYLVKLLDLPVENVLEKTSKDEFHCPGSMLRLLVDTQHPLGYGMRPEEAGYFNKSPAFRTRIPDGRFTRHIVARYPEDLPDILVSGYARGHELLERRAAVVEIGVGRGHVVLIGFKPQNRAQTHRTFKLLFNALLFPKLEEVELQ